MSVRGQGEERKTREDTLGRGGRAVRTHVHFARREARERVQERRHVIAHTVRVMVVLWRLREERIERVQLRLDLCHGQESELRP